MSPTTKPTEYPLTESPSFVPSYFPTMSPSDVSTVAVADSFPDLVMYLSVAVSVLLMVVLGMCFLLYRVFVARKGQNNKRQNTLGVRQNTRGGIGKAPGLIGPGTISMIHRQPEGRKSTDNAVVMMGMKRDSDDSVSEYYDSKQPQVSPGDV